MHKKSIEASEKLSAGKDGGTGGGADLTSRDKDNMRAESINTLRAKAQQHSAKVLKSYGTSGRGGGGDVGGGNGASPELNPPPPPPAGFTHSDTQDVTTGSNNTPRHSVLAADSVDALLLHGNH